MISRFERPLEEDEPALMARERRSFWQILRQIWFHGLSSALICVFFIAEIGPPSDWGSWEVLPLLFKGVLALAGLLLFGHSLILTRQLVLEHRNFKRNLLAKVKAE